jgi:hypothetical protein
MNERPAATLSWTREEDDQLRAASGTTVAAASKRLSRSEKATWLRVSRDREQGFQRIVSNDFRGS